MVLIIHFGNIVFWSAAPTATRQPRTCRVSEAHMSSPNPTWLPRLDTQKVSEWRPMMKSFCNVHDIIPSHFFRITSDWLRMLGRRNLAWTAEVARRPASWPKPWGIFLYVSRQYLCFCFHQSTYHYTTTACILALQGWRHRGNLRHPPTSSRLRLDQHAAGQGPDVERILVQPVCVCVCVCAIFLCRKRDFERELTSKFVFVGMDDDDTVVGSYLESASAEEKADMIEAVSALVKDGTLTSFVLVRLPFHFLLYFVA